MGCQILLPPEERRHAVKLPRSRCLLRRLVLVSRCCLRIYWRLLHLYSGNRRPVGLGKCRIGGVVCRGVVLLLYRRLYALHCVERALEDRLVPTSCKRRPVVSVDGSHGSVATSDECAYAMLQCSQRIPSLTARQRSLLIRINLALHFLTRQRQRLLGPLTLPDTMQRQIRKRRHTPLLPWI